MEVKVLPSPVFSSAQLSSFPCPPPAIFPTQVHDETSRAVSTETSLATAQLSLSEKIATIVTSGEKLFSAVLTVNNAREFLKCKSLYGYRYQNGACSPILAPRGFVASFGSQSIGVTSTWKTLPTVACTRAYDGVGYDHSSSTYTVNTEGLYLVTVANSATMNGVSSPRYAYYSTVAVNDVLDWGSGTIMVDAQSAINYDNLHLQTVLYLRPGDKLTLYQQSEYSSLSRSVKGRE